MKPYDTIIIGAGISGLIAAQILQREGRGVLLLEKSRGVGGRMATRRIGEAVLDHGAQFFTVRSDEYRVWVQRFVEEDIARIWCHGFGKDDGHPRYRGTKAMTGIPKWLAHNLNIHFQQRVEILSLQDDCVDLRTDSGEAYQAKSVILTAPLPQALDLIQQSRIIIEDVIIDSLKTIEYDPCIALLCVFDRETKVPDEGGLQVPNETIDFIADHFKKGISPVPAVTIHASAGFSRHHYESEDEAVSHQLLEAAKEWLPNPPTEVHVKRWKYSKPKDTLLHKYFRISDFPPVLLAGDAFDGAKVEGAALSGLHAAKALLQAS